MKYIPVTIIIITCISWTMTRKLGWSEELKRILLTVPFFFLYLAMSFLGVLFRMLQQPLRAPFFLLYRVMLTFLKVSSHFMGLVGWIGNRLRYLDIVFLLFSRIYIKPKKVDRAKRHLEANFQELPDDVMFDVPPDEIPVNKRLFAEAANNAERESIRDFRRGEFVVSIALTAFSLLLAYNPGLRRDLGIDAELDLIVTQLSVVASSTTVTNAIVGVLTFILVISVVFRNSFIRVLSISDASVFDSTKQLGFKYWWNRRFMRSPVLVTYLIDWLRVPADAIDVMLDRRESEIIESTQEVNTRPGASATGFWQGINNAIDGTYERAAKDKNPEEVLDEMSPGEPYTTRELSKSVGWPPKVTQRVLDAVVEDANLYRKNPNPWVTIWIKPEGSK